MSTLFSGPLYDTASVDIIVNGQLPLEGRFARNACCDFWV